MIPVSPASRSLDTVEAYEKFIATHEGSIVGFFEKESELKGVFTKYADQQREKFNFFHSSNPEVLLKAGET